MNAHALSVLQFDAVVDVVASHASSALGGAALRALRPSASRDAAADQLARVAAMRALVTGEPAWTSWPIPDVTNALSRLHVAGTTLPGPDLVGLGVLLRSSRLTASALGDQRTPAIARGVLAGTRERLVSAPRSEEALERALEPSGTVRDDASPVLRRTRRELRSAEGELVALLERVMARLEPHHRVIDASVTVRNGRYVIPVRREGRGVVGGLVHDASGSGATLFVEPPAAIEACNRIRELESGAAEEVERILRELTDGLYPLADPLVGSLEALVELDSLQARARYAERFQCFATTLREPAAGFSVLNGRHPLLLAKGAAVVAFDLSMDPAERTLLVSGPNTGGKTVLLKALGLLSLMAQAGIPAPAARESELACFENVFADVGDEQSIEASLSTFSAHLRNLAEILDAAGPSSLVLIDELGSGTDPLEGAALGGAILEALTSRGALSVATTHLGALKELAGEVPGIVNASLEFDAVALAPTYRLVKGIPGRSYGLSIARRLAIPEAVLERAEARIPAIEKDVRALLSSLEAQAAEMSRREQELATSIAAAQERAHRLAEREQRLRERERAVERESRKDARRHLLEARQEVERTLRDLRRAAEAERDDAARTARRNLERSAEAQSQRLDQIEREERNIARRSASPERGPLVEGEAVAVIPLDGRVGRVLVVRDNEVVVSLGGLKVTYPREALRRSDEPPPASAQVAIIGDVPDVTAATEIDVRGLRVDEVDDQVLRAVDAAVRADLHSLRVIHGKGTGALRARVAEMLSKDTRVRGFRLGLWNEGGAGVTVVDL